MGYHPYSPVRSLPLRHSRKHVFASLASLSARVSRRISRVALGPSSVRHGQQRQYYLPRGGHRNTARNPARSIPTSVVRREPICLQWQRSSINFGHLACEVTLSSQSNSSTDHSVSVARVRPYSKENRDVQPRWQSRNAIRASRRPSKRTSYVCQEVCEGKPLGNVLLV